MSCQKIYLEFENEEPGVLYQIDEPLGWDKMTLNLETKERTMFGRNFSFSNGEFPLTFEASFDTKKLGHQYEKIIYYDNKYGNGSCVNFHSTTCDEPSLLGRLNFKGAVKDGCSYFETNIIQEIKANVVDENEDVSADLKGTDTLKGLSGYVLPYETMCLKSKVLREIANQIADVIPSDNQSPNPDYAEFASRIFWNTNENGNRGRVNTVFNDYDLQDEHILNNFYGDSGDPPPLNSYNFSFSQDFDFIEVDLRLDLCTAFVESSLDVEDVNWSLILLHRDFQGNTKNQTTITSVTNDTISGSGLQLGSTRPYQDGLADSDFVLRNILHTQTVTDVKQGDTLMLYIYYEGNPVFNIGLKRLRMWTRTKDTSYFKITGDSTTEDSEHQIPRLKDVFTKIVDYISDGMVTVSMPEFEQGGEFYDYFLPNGYEVRKAGEIEDRQFVYDFKRAMQAINAIFAAGYQLYDNTIYIGSVRTFYTTEDLGFLDFYIEDVTIEYDEKLLLNLFKFKYKKVPKNEVNTIDEFNTSAEYSIPTDKTKGTLKVESEFIGSGYLLEDTRRKQFTENPTESTSYDDDIFIVNGVYDDVLGKYVNRTIEDIDPINNLISPETSYNLAINPLENFNRWSPYVLSAKHYNTISDNVRVTNFEHNEFMSAQVQDPEALNLPLAQKGDYLTGIFKEHIFEPRIINIIGSGLSEKKLLKIKDDIILKRGFYKVKNKKGEIKEFYILDFDYQICEQKLTIKGILKNENYV